MSNEPPDDDDRVAVETGAVTVHRSGPGTLGRRDRSPVRARPVSPAPPLSPQQRRRVRLWMILMLFTPLCLGGIVLLTVTTGGPSEPTVDPVHTPAGFYGVTDAYFGYAVPNSYQQNASWTDQDADFFYGEPAGFVAETLVVTKTSPSPATVPPASLKDFGEPDPEPYTVSGGHPIRVPGTAYGYEEDVTRPGGFHAVAVDTWERSTETELWLLVRAPAATTTDVLASLQG